MARTDEGVLLTISLKMNKAGANLPIRNALKRNQKQTYKKPHFKAIDNGTKYMEEEVINSLKMLHISNHCEFATDLLLLCQIV